MKCRLYQNKQHARLVPSHSPQPMHTLLRVQLASRPKLEPILQALAVSLCVRFARVPLTRVARQRPADAVSFAIALHTAFVPYQQARLDSCVRARSCAVHPNGRLRRSFHTSASNRRQIPLFAHTHNTLAVLSTLRWLSERHRRA